MTNLRRRLKKLEERLTDPSGLVPHTPKWLAYWDREIFDFMMASDGGRPPVLFPLNAFRAVVKYIGNPASLVGSIPEIGE